MIYSLTEHKYMNINELKQKMIIPKEEYIINKEILINGKEALILSYTVEEHKKILWILYNCGTCSSGNGDIGEFKTKEEEKLFHIEREADEYFVNIRKVEIQGQTVNISSSSMERIIEDYYDGICKLQHFIELNIIPEKWHNIQLDNFFIAEYNIDEREQEFKIDTERKIDIKLYVDDEIKEVYIGKSFIGQAMEYEKNTKISYFDKTSSKESHIYLNKIELSDVHSEMDAAMSVIEDSEIKENYRKGMLECYPENRTLLKIYYETDDDVQVNFCTRKYLDEAPDHSNISTAFMDSCKDEKGKNGYKMRCEYADIGFDEKFEGEFQIVAFSKILKIKGSVYY